MATRLVFLIIIATLFSCQQRVTPKWPEATYETKPWTRWWWQGNSLTKEGITAELEAYEKAGLGGVEITPIYGVHGYEDQFIPYLSDQWMELLIYTLQEANRLGMGVDMATGTGWPFGGPWVKDSIACRNIYHKAFELKKGERLKEKIEFIQSPFLRAVGYQVYEVQEVPNPEQNAGTRKEPLLRLDPNTLNIKDLVQPVEANRNLQQLALDQVQFERSLPLMTLMAYDESGRSTDITKHVQRDGHLDWTPPPGKWKLHALFMGWHGKMVERAGPGGEGNVIDHFSKTALTQYLDRFDSAFKTNDIKSVRAFFNDSYEVDDARGSADWTPQLLKEFRQRRGYALEDHLPSLFGSSDNDKDRRILYDYRLTISELLLENFTAPWTLWASKNNALTRNQAHGSPANILDLYATVDIPEIEGTDPLRIRMASSAGNVTGKSLVSSESATWLDEHFESDLGEIKTAVDLFLLNGVNHIFYHGTNYSPPGEPWPGWLFYAAVHLNPRNSQWSDLHALNTYVERCQSFLQHSKPDNDVLLYYPVADPMSAFGEEMIQHFDGIGKQFAGSAFDSAATSMLQKGYTFDFISDKQVQALRYENGKLVTSGDAEYKTIIVPHCSYIPNETLKKILSLVHDGAPIIIYNGFPTSFSGYSEFKKNLAEFDRLKLSFENPPVDKGSIIWTNVLPDALSDAGVTRESIAHSGMEFTRRSLSDGKTVYLLRNTGPDFDGWITLNAPAKSFTYYDPMTGAIGKAAMNKSSDHNNIRLQLVGNQSIIVVAETSKVDAEGFIYFEKTPDPIVINGTWSIHFESGGPVLPADIQTDTLGSWTTFQGKGYQEFSGTTLYSIHFPRPSGGENGWWLDLGEVDESARVSLNGKDVGTVIARPFRVKIEPSMAQPDNLLEVRVSNLMANRVADLDKRGIFWKKFYNVNFPARKGENRKDGLFDASKWAPRPSGLHGPVQLFSVEIRSAE